MVKIAYIITAHNTPNHLKRLVEALITPTSACFIHLDKKTDMAGYEHIKQDRVYFTENRISVHWSDYTQVEASLIILREALAHPEHFDRIVFISGSDYPLKNKAFIQEFFDKHPDTEFLNIVKMGENNVKKGLERLTNYRTYSGDSVFKKGFKWLKVQLRLDSYKGRDYKPAFGELIPYGGSNWWALTRKACEDFLEYIENNPEYINFMRNTIFVDESIFQTVLTHLGYKDKMTANVTYCDWSEDKANPAWIEQKHVDFFKTSDLIIDQKDYGRGQVLFARKFQDDSKHLTDQIDQMANG